MTGILLFIICVKKKCYSSHMLPTRDFRIVANILVSVNSERNCCACHVLQHEVQDNPHLLTKVMEPGITGMIQKQNSCYHSVNVLTMVGLHSIFILTD